MQSYTVHLPPSSSEEERLSKAVFVRDGFHLVALIAPPLWLLWYRQWLGLALYLAALVVLEFATEFAPFWVLSVVNLLFGIGIALEASTLRRWRLAAKGWTLTAALAAHDLEDAEERFFANLNRERNIKNTPIRTGSGIPSIALKPASSPSTPTIIGYQ